MWSDGSLVQDKVAGVGIAGSRVYAHASGAAWFHRAIWTYFHHYLTVGVKPVDSIVLFPVLCRRFSGLRFGGCWLHCRVVFVRM